MRGWLNDRFDKLQRAAGAWRWLREAVFHPVMPIIAGAFLEIHAGLLLPTSAGKATPVDETYSLCATILIALGTLWYLRRLGRVPLELKIAMVLVIGAKSLDLIANISTFNYVPLIGREDMRSKTLQAVLFGAGTVLTLLGTIRLARRIWRSTLELRRRNAALVREREELELVRHALERSERMLQIVIDSIPEGVFWKDRELRYLGANQRHADHFGKRSPAALTGRSDNDFPWLNDLADLYHACDRRVLETGQPMYNIIEQTRHEDGTVRWLRTSKVPLRDGTGEIFGVLGTSEDITEDKRLQDERARLVTAIEQTDESVLITDPEGVILYVNPAFERASGYSSAEVLGRKPRILRSGAHEPAFYENLWQTIRRGEIWHGLFINRRKDGAIYEEQAVISPVRNGEGATINYVALKRNVTNERLLERQLRQAQKMEAIGQLAGGVAHDFNNLLQVIGGYTEMALAVLPPEDKAARQLELGRGAIGRAARLVRQLLMFGRQQVGQPETIDLNNVVADMLKMLRRLIGENIDLILKPGYKPQMVYADPGQMEQVIMNLCVNARDAMPDGGRVTIETSGVTLDASFCTDHPWAHPGEYVLISVSDTGVGIPIDMQEHIFEPFYSTKEVGKGTGLGLATVYGIIHQHRGAVQVYSEAGKGATFRIYLPAVDGEAEASTPLSNERPEDIPGGTETILIAEDDELVRELAVELLVQKGYHVLAASDGVEAMELFEQHQDRIGLVLADVVMPRASGRALCEYVVARRPHLPVVFCSGYSRDVLKDKLLGGEERTLIHKPYNRVTLLKRVREALDAAHGMGLD
jgi:PAS domain S-box-containing protein